MASVILVELRGDIHFLLGEGVDPRVIHTRGDVAGRSHKEQDIPSSPQQEEEGQSVPVLNVRRLVFAEIPDVWEAFIPCTAALCLRSQGKTYEVVLTLLPDHETYLEVAGYIYSLVVASGA